MKCFHRYSRKQTRSCGLAAQILITAVGFRNIKKAEASTDKSSCPTVFTQDMKRQTLDSSRLVLHAVDAVKWGWGTSLLSWHWCTSGSFLNGSASRRYVDVSRYQEEAYINPSPWYQISTIAVSVSWIAVIHSMPQMGLNQTNKWIKI